MKKDLSNVTLTISLLFIFSISIYFIVQWVRSENINHYLDLLGNKLLAMVPEDEKKDEVAQMYDKFRQQVEENKVEPEKVEKVAVEILNMENHNDSLGLRNIEKAMQQALSTPVVVKPEIVVEPSIAGERTDTPPPVNERKWRELRNHLKNAYEFEENLKQHRQQKDLLDRRFFRYDSNLQIIVDSRLRKELLQGVDQAMIESIKELEKQKLLVWKDNYVQDLQDKLKILDDSLGTLELKLGKVPVSIPVKVYIPGADSLRINIKISPDSTTAPVLPKP